ncbi:hypothetical protein ONZ45_g2269 [Pleurotus djamor]|nr:hypothetical protein ONZ45_g2269 [Pleurotus djamor]
MSRKAEDYSDDSEEYALSESLWYDDTKIEEAEAKRDREDSDYIPSSSQESNSSNESQCSASQVSTSSEESAKFTDDDDDGSDEFESEDDAVEVIDRAMSITPTPAQPTHTSWPKSLDEDDPEVDRNEPEPLFLPSSSQESDHAENEAADKEPFSSSQGWSWPSSSQ